MNDKKQAFTEEYLKDCNATQAAIRAGYSPHTAKQQGSRLLTNVDVRTRIGALQDQAAARNRVEIDEIIGKLRGAYDEAMGDGRYGAAVRAAELLGKHIGMFSDKVQASVSHHYSNASEEDLTAEIARLAQIAGIDLSAEVAEFEREEVAAT